MSKVIQNFPWSENGYTIKQARVGDDSDFGDLTASLVEAGYILDEVDSNGGNTGSKPRPDNVGKRKA